MDRVEAENRRAKNESRKDVMRSRNEKLEDNLETRREVIEDAAGKVAQSTQKREKNVKRTLENVRICEEAAARCTKVIKRRLLKKHARKARAEHLVNCSSAPGRRKKQRKPLSELHVNGNLTEDTEEWQKELQRHCEEVYTDQAETREVQEKRIECSKQKGDRQCADDGTREEINVDLVL